VGLTGSAPAVGLAMSSVQDSSRCRDAQTGGGQGPAVSVISTTASAMSGSWPRGAVGQADLGLDALLLEQAPGQLGILGGAATNRRADPTPG